MVKFRIVCYDLLSNRYYYHVINGGKYTGLTRDLANKKKINGGATLLTNHLDFRLEPKIIELYEEHKKRSEKIDWGYHEFLPWDKGMDFRRVPWEESQIGRAHV